MENIAIAPVGKLCFSLEMCCPSSVERNTGLDPNKAHHWKPRAMTMGGGLWAQYARVRNANKAFEEAQWPSLLYFESVLLSGDFFSFFFVLYVRGCLPQFYTHWSLWVERTARPTSHSGISNTVWVHFKLWEHSWSQWGRMHQEWMDSSSAL